MADGRSTDREAERELVARARRGDMAAFTALFHAHRDMLFGLALRLTADADLAEEVALEAFTKAWTRLSDFRGESRFSTWLCGIALNTARHRLRGRANRRRRQAPLTPILARLSRDPPPVEEAVDLERAIALLPPRAREALLLRHVQGLSCEEAAAAMGVTSGTIKSQTARACGLLRERLGDD